MNAQEVLTRSIAHVQLSAPVTFASGLAHAAVSLGGQRAALSRRAAALGVLLTELPGDEPQVFAAPLRDAARGDVTGNVHRWSELVPLGLGEPGRLRQASWVRPSPQERQALQARGGAAMWRPSLDPEGERPALVAVRAGPMGTQVAWTSPAGWMGYWSWWPLPTPYADDDAGLDDLAVRAGARLCGLSGESWLWPTGSLVQGDARPC